MLSALLGWLFWEAMQWRFCKSNKRTGEPVRLEQPDGNMDKKVELG